MITSNIRILELYCQKKLQIEAQIKELIESEIDAIDNTVKNIKSIPGVSLKTITSLLGECGDIRRFDSAKAFIGYLGLYPTQYQSGSRLAKRGIPIAKHALYMAAVGSVLHNNELKKLFYDKISSGKSKKEALIILSKKLVTIIFAIAKHNKPYDPNRVFIPN